MVNSFGITIQAITPEQKTQAQTYVQKCKAEVGIDADSASQIRGGNFDIDSRKAQVRSFEFDWNSRKFNFVATSTVLRKMFLQAVSDSIAVHVNLINFFTFLALVSWTKMTNLSEMWLLRSWRQNITSSRPSSRKSSTSASKKRATMDAKLLIKSSNVIEQTDKLRTVSHRTPKLVPAPQLPAQFQQHQLSPS